MTIEAPISKFKRQNILIYIVICIIMAGWFGYDGYINKNFIKEHTDENGKADTTLAFNQKSPPFFIAAALVFGVYFAMLRGKKLLAAEDELIINDKKRIKYDTIEKINKTWFESKGYFIITCKDKNGKETSHKISDRAYDGIDKILNLLVEKIS